VEIDSGKCETMVLETSLDVSDCRARTGNIGRKHRVIGVKCERLRVVGPGAGGTDDTGFVNRGL